MTKGPSEISEEQYLSIVSDLHEKMSTVLMFNRGCEEDVGAFVSEHGCPAVEYNEALAWLLLAENPNIPPEATSVSITVNGQEYVFDTGTGDAAADDQGLVNPIIPEESLSQEEMRDIGISNWHDIMTESWNNYDQQQGTDSSEFDDIW